jgi:hypothetical protein
MYLLLIPSIILLAIVGFMVVPFHLSFDLKIKGLFVTGFYEVSWFGLTLRRAELSAPKGAEDREKLEHKKKLREKKDSGRTKDKNNDLANKRGSVDRSPFLKDPRMFIDAMPSFFRVLQDFMRTIHIERPLFKITLGLDDPANTAIFCGYLWSITSSVPTPSTVCIDPYFGGDRLDGSLNAEIRVRLLRVFIAFFNSLREKPIRRLLIETHWKGFEDLRNKLQIKWPISGRGEKSNGNGVWSFWS